MQEQLQAERDLRAALEVGLSMSNGQFSSSRGMDSKVCLSINITSICFLEVTCNTENFDLNLFEDKGRA